LNICVTLGNLLQALHQEFFAISKISPWGMYDFKTSELLLHRFAETKQPVRFELPPFFFEISAQSDPIRYYRDKEIDLYFWHKRVIFGPTSIPKTLLCVSHKKLELIPVSPYSQSSQHAVIRNVGVPPSTAALTEPVSKVVNNGCGFVDPIGRAVIWIMMDV
ncbi:MAG: hypothetical protein Q9181_006040, partial [Wetmoreana brouardii]